jgi:SAM-dependent methyltransferase
MKQWNQLFKKRGKVFLKPQEDIPRVAKLFKRKNIKRLLDLGCGSGRHLVYFAKKGFDVYGIDIAEEGIKIARKWLKKEKLKAKLERGSVYKKLPYNSNFFDAVVSVQVLQHGKLNQIKKGVEEIKRVLKPGGLIFITLFGRYSKGKARYCVIKDAREVAPRTYVPRTGDEAGVTHYVYDKSIIKKHYKDFKIIDLWRDKKDYYCFLGKLKYEGKNK